LKLTVPSLQAREFPVHLGASSALARAAENLQGTCLFQLSELDTAAAAAARPDTADYFAVSFAAREADEAEAQGGAEQSPVAMSLTCLESICSRK
jgi:hypothetical protein